MDIPTGRGAARGGAGVRGAGRGVRNFDGRD